MKRLIVKTVAVGLVLASPLVARASCSQVAIPVGQWTYAGMLEDTRTAPYCTNSGPANACYPDGTVPLVMTDQELDGSGNPVPDYSDYVTNYTTQMCDQ